MGGPDAGHAPAGGGRPSPGGRLRLGAYVLLGDPAFLRQSVRSYYHLVRRIVAVHDTAGIGWTGEPLRVDECMAVLEELDTEHKVVHLPGTFHDAGTEPLVSETHERNVALHAAGEGVDWVLQIDTDEVLGDPDRLVASIERADAAGRSAVEYPARWLYGRVGGQWFLERCRRFWGISGNFPGPVAVRPGTTLSLARQCDVPLWRVDFRRRNSDPAHVADAPVDECVGPREGIWHFSWVRSEADLRSKSRTSGHAAEYDWDREIDRWVARCRRPWTTTALTPARRSPAIVGAPTWLRVARLPDGLPLEP